MLMPKSLKIPDFVIAGAPRCGTTSLASYLAEHPQVFFSRIKEPNYFCFDAPGLRVVDTNEAYSHLFAGAAPGQLLGEGSTAYLFSNTALPALLDAKPNVQVILSVRNPLQMVVSYHGQKVYAFEEDEREFGRAWRLSAARAVGQAVHHGCRAPLYLDYRAVGRMGEQVARAKRIVPGNQLHVVVFDDLRSDPEAVYSGLERFLMLDHHPLGRFPVTNAQQAHALPAVGRFLMRPPPLLRGAKRYLQRLFPVQAKAVGKKLYALNRSASPKAQLPQDIRAEMVAAFADDVALLSRALGRDLEHWLAPA